MLHQRSYGTKWSRMDQVKYVEDSLLKIWSDMVYLSRPHHFKFFKGCLLQISLGPFLNILSHIISLENYFSCTSPEETPTNNNFCLSQLWIISLTYCLVFTWVNLHLVSLSELQWRSSLNSLFGNTLSNKSAVRFTKFC